MTTPAQPGQQLLITVTFKVTLNNHSVYIDNMFNYQDLVAFISLLLFFVMSDNVNTNQEIKLF